MSRNLPGAMAMVFAALLSGCNSVAPAASQATDIVITQPGLSDAQSRERLAELRLPANATVIIYLHGTKNPVDREDCLYRSNQVPESLRSVESLPNIYVYFLCSQAVDGNLEGSYIAKRADEVRVVLGKLASAGIPPEHIFLAGHSAGAWVSLLLAAQEADKFNAVIGFAPACCGRRDLEQNYPRWRASIRPRQVEQMLSGAPIAALVFAYEDDIYNRPSELKFLSTAYPDSVQLVAYDCQGGHNTHIDDCRAVDTGKIIRTYIQERLADG